MQGLREKKYAATRVGLLRAALVRLQATAFDSITVKDLCEDAGVAQATFFNHFPEKSDLLVYYMQIWGLSVSLALEKRKGDGAFQKILSVFEHTLSEMDDHPRLMFEIVAYIARAARPPEVVPLTVAERRLAFPNDPSALTATVLTLRDAFAGILREAKANKELRANANVDDLVTGIVSIFYGVPIATRGAHVDSIGTSYQKQLEIYFRGILSPGKKNHERKQ
ncbi:MAG: TetR/AcrR family transcriptional regulator [Spirochaetia bacterium]|nr:TetR/AcrR family transcriptional regulator [Spirochaetia bacterium]